ncbi:hypothetical protein Tco_0485277 [Tanacetum coccineum]
MKTKRKLVPKSTGNDAAQHTGTVNVGLQSLADDIGGSKRRCIRQPNLVSRGDLALHIDQTSAVMSTSSVLRRESALRIGQTSTAMDRPQMLQMTLTPNVIVPQLERFDAVQGADIGSGGLQNLVDDVGCLKRQCIREPNSVLRGDSVLHLQQTLAGIDRPQMLQGPSTIHVNVPQPKSIPHVSTSNRVHVSYGASHSRVAETSTNSVVRPNTQSVPSGPPPSSPPSGYMSLGRCEHSCQHCGALWTRPEG